MSVKICFITTPPKDVYLAYSGGVDSSVLLYTLMRRKYNVTLLVVDHNTEFSKLEIHQAREAARKYEIPVVIKSMPVFDHSTSLERFWSTHRNNRFQSMDKPVCVAHHLDDAVETYVMSSMQGLGKTLSVINNNVIRPMLTMRKADIVAFAKARNISYIEDPTNSDVEFNLRNKIRHQLIPEIQKVFPGIASVVKRLVVQKYTRDVLQKSHPNKTGDT